MPAPIIPQIPTLTIRKDTRQGQNLLIRNSPLWARGEMEWIGLDVYLTGSNLYIGFSNPAIKVGTYTCRVIVGNNDGFAERNVTIVVQDTVSPPSPGQRPVISRRVSTIVVRRSVNYTENPIQIPISNNPVVARITATTLGLDTRLYDGGMEIIGRPSLRSPRKFFSASDGNSVRFMANLFASNPSGSDSHNVTVDYRGAE